MNRKFEKPRVLHIITSLDVGGAETMILKLVQNHCCSVNSYLVVLTGPGALSEKLDKMKIPVLYLGISRGRLPKLKTIKKMISFAKQHQPEIIQGWMYHGNLAASFLKLILKPNSFLIWNIRQTLSEPKREKPLTNLIINVCAFISIMPSKIVFNSYLSAEQHQKRGFRKSSCLIIPNGFDLDGFKPNARLREKIRFHMGIKTNVVLVGHVARFHPMKDHAGMLRAASKVLEKKSDVIFAFAGLNMNQNNVEIVRLIKDLKLEKNILLLDERKDLEVLMTAFDLFVSSSAWGEGFPNVVGEAMATCVPCVVTDCGDSSYVVGNVGAVVPTLNVKALSEAIVKMIDMPAKARVSLGLECRKRIETRFSIDKVGNAYLKLYKEAAAY